MSIKTTLLSLLIVCLFNTVVYAQSTMDISEQNTIHRLIVTPLEDEYYRISLKPIIKGEFSNIDTVSEVVVGLKENTYKIVINKLVNDEWKKDIQDSSIAGFNEHNKKIDEIKQSLITSLIESFSDIKLKSELFKVERSMVKDNDMSDKDIQNHKKYLAELDIIQNKIKLINSIKKLKCKKETTTNILEFNAYKYKNDILSTTDSNSYTQKLMYLPKKTLNLIKDTMFFYQRSITNALRQIDNRRSTMVYLIGDARVISSFKNTKSSDINAGFGLLAVKPGLSEFIGIVTVAQAYEDSTRDFGQSILVPGVQRFSLLTRFRSYSIFKYSCNQFLKRVGVGLDVNITPYTWTKDNTEPIKVIPLAINLLVPYTWVHENKPGQDYAISTDVGLSIRSVAGSATNEQIKDYLGLSKLPLLRTYMGPIIGLNIKYNALRVQFHAPLLITNNSNRVQGLTNGQVYASIGIIANLTGDISKYLKKATE